MPPGECFITINLMTAPSCVRKFKRERFSAPLQREKRLEI
jgi:hypothetical protein